MIFQRNCNLYNDTLPYSDIDFFEIVVGVLQGDIWAPFLFIICLQTSIDLMKENDFTVKKARSRQYPAETITDADYADDLVLPKNTPAYAKFQQHSLEQTARDIGSM